MGLTQLFEAFEGYGIAPSSPAPMQWVVLIDRWWHVWVGGLRGRAGTGFEFPPARLFVGRFGIFHVLVSLRAASDRSMATRLLIAYLSGCSGVVPACRLVPLCAEGDITDAGIPVPASR